MRHLAAPHLSYQGATILAEQAIRASIEVREAMHAYREARTAFYRANMELCFSMTRAAFAPFSAWKYETEQVGQ